MSLEAHISKVQFLDIQESYDLGEPVTFWCRYTDDLIPDAKDWVGLYRVGWSNTRDYVTYNWVSLPENFDLQIDKKFSITFKDNLPRADEDFFQFCYVDSTGRVCGISLPFQFIEDYDILVVEETDSLMIVGPKTAQTVARVNSTSLHDELCNNEVSMAQTRVEELTRELEATKALLSEKDRELNEMKSLVKEVNAQLSKTKKDCSEFAKKESMYCQKEKSLTFALQDLQKDVCQKAQEVELLKMEHSKTENILSITQGSVDDLKNRCIKLMTQLSQSKKQCENFSKLEEEWKSKESDFQNQIKQLELTLKQLHDQNIEKDVNNSLEDVYVDASMDAITNETSAGAVANDDSVLSYSPDEVCKVGSCVKCITCELLFPSNTSSQVIHEHLEDHKRPCPFCNARFDALRSQEEYESHVYGHMTETIRFPNGQRECPMCSKKFSKEISDDEFMDHVESHF